ncbi:hypothetical protein GE061_019905 [Apolygus lucorum]|uniref:Large ribosomal subunit protein P2 n=1 Tax=Apolygus lucorum TaxID=248454 RepID=A0A8S9X9Q3_APOLU|nr:hypothetical protein GE061_019905 [Apolygus lucorum]
MFIFSAILVNADDLSSSFYHFSNLIFSVNHVSCRYDLKMRYVAAYLLAALGGKESPSSADIEKILSSVGIEADNEKLNKVISELKGKNVDEVIAKGKEKLATLPLEVPQLRKPRRKRRKKNLTNQMTIWASVCSIEFLVYGLNFSQRIFDRFDESSHHHLPAEYFSRCWSDSINPLFIMKMRMNSAAWMDGLVGVATVSLQFPVSSSLYGISTYHLTGGLPITPRSSELFDSQEKFKKETQISSRLDVISSLRKRTTLLNFENETRNLTFGDAVPRFRRETRSCLIFESILIRLNHETFVAFYNEIRKEYSV